MYEIIQNDEGKITNVLVDGKPVKKSFMRGLKKAQETSFFKFFTGGRTAVNPFSGVSVGLNFLEYSIYHWCAQWYARYASGEMPTPIQVYDDMKYFFMSLNSQAYMDLLD